MDIKKTNTTIEMTKKYFGSIFMSEFLLFSFSSLSSFRFQFYIYFFYSFIPHGEACLRGAKIF